MSSGKLHFAKIWESNAKLVGDSPALINDSQVVSWSEYESQASKIANFLQEKGLKQDLSLIHISEPTRPERI